MAEITDVDVDERGRTPDTMPQAKIAPVSEALTVAGKMATAYFTGNMKVKLVKFSSGVITDATYIINIYDPDGALLYNKTANAKSTVIYDLLTWDNVFPLCSQESGDPYYATFTWPTTDETQPAGKFKFSLTSW